ncbi:NAD(P)-dependent oxidoreductase [Conexibacter sp. CPCC 206217]|uniref:NAD-dependent epimerase/dehydratase family protein n=1 Tax=Conexibacter sp. CPCC 206217 TaxID=3064574 RepID=UPI00271EBBD4|nr:NAD(P)-dependent oxidoreductase [Conexibacter sp. CPCC 206217]MDO8208922.1 NAD(P)-dependent oxidoreductase [Conexibacter sp. CPCC 206217]
MSLRLLVTGAGGRMAQVLLPQLRRRYGPMTLLARSAVEDADADDRVQLADVADLDAVIAAAAGADAILHLAGIADEAPYEKILASNIVGAYNVFEAARRTGVRRVVFASSNHVTGFYRCGERIGVEDAVRPDTHYGASKVYGEALGQLYHDKFGLEVVSLRIGSFRAVPDDHRQLSTWLSHRDGLDLIVRSLETPGVGHLVVYGVSANTRAWWRLGPEAEALGYAPRDDAERFAAQLDGPHPDDSDLRQGGIYVEPGYGGGYW